jgi:uncharacterized Fe-S cluster protein YjdI
MSQQALASERKSLWGRNTDIKSIRNACNHIETCTDQQSILNSLLTDPYLEQR